MKASYLVCYDITKPRRLSRVYKYMKSRGLHLQYSVFYCRLTWPELQNLKNELLELIDEKKDDIRIYPLPAGYKVEILGQGDRVPEGVDVFL